MGPGGVYRSPAREVLIELEWEEVIVLFEEVIMSEISRLARAVTAEGAKSMEHAERMMKVQREFERRIVTKATITNVTYQLMHQDRFETNKSNKFIESLWNS